MGYPLFLLLHFFNDFLQEWQLLIECPRGSSKKVEVLQGRGCGS